jgi:hypothetical protein
MPPSSSANCWSVCSGKLGSNNSVKPLAKGVYVLGLPESSLPAILLRMSVSAARFFMR